MKKITLNILVLLTLVFSLNAQVKVACVGNSITYGSGIQERENFNYPKQLGDMLGSGWEVRNFGNSGSTMLKNGNKPYWNQPEYQQAMEFKPEVVIIKLGTNDSKPYNWKFRDEFENNYSEMIENFMSLGTVKKIYICLPIPAVEPRWDISPEVIKNEVIPMVKAIAEKNKVEVIDLYSPFIGKENLIEDKIHPNAQGATLIAKTIEPILKKWKMEVYDKQGNEL